ncbi:putative germin-like protein 2-1 [Coffea eugenioides]|uniref:putative germin-like protein 2-1 n=1 Tax=Coffea eugenioides TaxID=49369 RepID=UPI000F5C3848|nr:putative germin-like protein 2-1 [Coffea arabica]XP_027150206.1 putative germin-like protein 2-1 [Coffea eugenioides]
MGAPFLITIAAMALLSSLAVASDPSPSQDFCVAINDPNTAVFVNGKICKHPKVVNADDFFFQGLNKLGNAANQQGCNVTSANANNLAGLNTLGVSLARLDFFPYGLNPPHTHPRATEVLFVLEGTLHVGFVTSNPPNNMKNQLFTKTLNLGEIFIPFPLKKKEGLIHFQFNVGKMNVVAFVGFSSQNPRVNTIANAVFGSNPPISPDVITKVLLLDNKVIDLLEA